MDAADTKQLKQWIHRLTRFLKLRKEQLIPGTTEITGEAAAKIIAESCGQQPLDVRIDIAEAERLGVRHSALVSVIPSDNGIHISITTKLIGVLTHIS